MNSHSLERTTAPDRKSFVEVEETSDFPIQNLPYGVFSTNDGETRCGARIGDHVLDLAALERDGILEVGPEPLFADRSLNRFAAQPAAVRHRVRCELSQLLDIDEARLRDNAELRSRALIPVDQVTMHLPMVVGDYTDFYSSKDHATNVGTMMRGADNALQENWLHLPVAYHGRASSVVVSGTPVRRPQGQLGAGRFGPSKAMDFELEMGFFVCSDSNLGEPVPIDRAHEHIFGLSLVNDWSARDIQKWEYVPLGPFLAKNFATSIAPWIVSLEALEPFRKTAVSQDPAPLPYLQAASHDSYDIELEVIITPEGGEAFTVTRSNFQHLYWTMAQQLAHHTITGCNLRVGDLLASGTISGPEPESRGCLLERTWRGAEPLTLPNGDQRVFLQDGDEVTIRGWCQGDGYRIGLGEVSGKLLPTAEAG